MNNVVSIIVPVYHVKNYLHKCVDSLLSQTYSNIEVILVDDGGDDECPQICDEYCCKDKRVKCIHKQNEGQSMARKSGLLSATGEYIMYVDGDDWLEEDTVEECVNVASKECADVVCFGYKRIYEKRVFNTGIFECDCQFYGKEIGSIQRRIIGLTGSELSNVEKADRLAPMWGKLYTRNVAESGRWISEREIGSSEDAVYNLYALQKCKKFVYINQYLYCYRKTNDNATTKKFRPNLVEEWTKLFHVFEEYITSVNGSEEYFVALNNRIALSMIGIGLNELASNRSLINKSKKIKKVLLKEMWRNAYYKLDYQYFPLKWRVFFWCCKYRKATILIIMLSLIEKLKSIIAN